MSFSLTRSVVSCFALAMSTLSSMMRFSASLRWVATGSEEKPGRCCMAPRNSSTSENRMGAPSTSAATPSKGARAEARDAKSRKEAAETARREGIMGMLFSRIQALERAGIRWARRRHALGAALLSGNLVEVEADRRTLLELVHLGLAHLLAMLHRELGADGGAHFGEGQRRSRFDAILQADEVNAVGAAHRARNPAGARVEHFAQAGGNLGGLAEGQRREIEAGVERVLGG